MSSIRNSTSSSSEKNDLNQHILLLLYYLRMTAWLLQNQQPPVSPQHQPTTHDNRATSIIPAFIYLRPCCLQAIKRNPFLVSISPLLIALFALMSIVEMLLISVLHGNDNLAILPAILFILIRTRINSISHIQVYLKIYYFCSFNSKLNFSDQNKIAQTTNSHINLVNKQKMSKIMLFGATGQCGKAFLKLLSSNQTVHVIACTRNLEKVDKQKLRYKNVEWIKANPFESSSYEQRMGECSLVVSFLGSEDTKNVNIYSGAYPVILKAMQNKNMQRLVAVTSAYQESEKNFFFRNFVKPVFLDKVLADQLKFETWLKKSYDGKVVYTVLKPFRLGDEGGKKTKSERYCAELISTEKVKWQYKTDIYDLAQQIINIRDKNLYLNQFLNLGYTDK